MPRLGQGRLASAVRRMAGFAQEGLDRIVLGVDEWDGVDHRPTGVGDGLAHSATRVAHHIGRSSQSVRRRSAGPAGNPNRVARHVLEARHGLPLQPHSGMVLCHGWLRGSQCRARDTLARDQPNAVGGRRALERKSTPGPRRTSAPLVTWRANVGRFTQRGSGSRQDERVDGDGTAGGILGPGRTWAGGDDGHPRGA